MAGKRKHETAPAPSRERLARTTVTGGAREVSSSMRIGRLMTGSTPLCPLVDFADNPAGPLRARTTVSLDATTIERAVVTGQNAVLAFENGDLRLPIVTGLVQTELAATPFQELLIATRAAVSGPRTGKAAPVEARLDGERVVLEGKKEILLKCGEASITLRSDGRMVLRGAYVETYAKGLNRIKGGSVKIN
jgi:hypothetical protein